MEILSSRTVIHPVDLERSRRFYEDLIGLSISREWGVGVAYFLGGGLLELSGVVTPDGGASSVGGTTLWLQIPTLAGVEDRLRAGGVTVVKPSERMPWGLLELWVQDPDGNELRFVEVPADHPLRRRG